MGQDHGHRLPLGGLQQDQGEEELVPRGDEREHQRRDQAGRQQRQHHAGEDAETARAVDGGGLLQGQRHRLDVALEHPQRERQIPHHVHQDQARQGVDHLEVLQHQEQRNDDQHQREHLAEQNPHRPRPADPRPVADHHVGGGHGYRHGDQRGAAGHQQAVERRARQRVGVERDAVVLQARLARNPRRIDGAQLLRRLEGRRQQPQQREGQEDQVADQRHVLAQAPGGPPGPPPARNGRRGRNHPAHRSLLPVPLPAAARAPRVCGGFASPPARRCAGGVGVCGPAAAHAPRVCGGFASPPARRCAGGVGVCGPAAARAPRVCGGFASPPARRCAGGVGVCGPAAARAPLTRSPPSGGCAGTRPAAPQSRRPSPGPSPRHSRTGRT